MKRIVGISEFKVSHDQEDVLITYALGSCIAVVVYEPKVKVGGMLHFMLPDSSIDSKKAAAKPAMFADTGIPLLFKACYGLGAEKKRMVVKIAGGGNILDNNNFFKIGERNITAARKMFWRNKVLIENENVGEKHNRTVELDISTGKVIVRNSKGLLLEL